IDTGREYYQHRVAVAVAHQPRAHLIPAAHGTARRNAGVVGMPEPHLAARTTGDALGNGRAAVFLECGRIKHAVGDALALLALGNALADFLGVELEPDIRLARAHSVPFAVADHAPARQDDASVGERVVILHDRPPADRERRGRAPVHRTEAQPVLRDVEWRHDVPS